MNVQKKIKIKIRKDRFTIIHLILYVSTPIYPLSIKRINIPSQTLRKRKLGWRKRVSRFQKKEKKGGK
jgi:hypothetical protein